LATNLLFLDIFQLILAKLLSVNALFLAIVNTT